MSQSKYQINRIPPGYSDVALETKPLHAPPYKGQLHMHNSYLGTYACANRDICTSEDTRHLDYNVYQPFI